MPPKTKATRKAPAKGKAGKVETRGRKLGLTVEIMLEIEQILKEGNYQQTAYECVGVGKDGYYDWIKRGIAAKEKALNGHKLTADEQLLSEFADTIKKAIAFGKRRNVGLIAQAAIKDWHAAAWMLERTDPERYGRRDKVNVDSKVEQTLKIENKQVEELIASLPEEELLRIVRDAKRDDAESPADDKELLN